MIPTSIDRPPHAVPAGEGEGDGNPAADRSESKQRLAAIWHGYRRLTRLGFPPRFQLVQFPNLPLIIGFVAGTASGMVHGTTHPYLAAVGYLAMTTWAYEELVHGSNWFRHLLGLGYAVLLVVRVAHAIQG